MPTPVETTVPPATDLQRAIGFPPAAFGPETDAARHKVRRYINLKLAASGMPTVELAAADDALAAIPQGLLDQHCEKTRLLRDHRCPVDRRIEAFLASHFADVLDGDERLRVPAMTFVLDRHGIARELGLPHNGDCFKNDLVHSTRVKQGVLHNPRSDRRTTAGTFHVCAGGLPTPGDKKEVPREAFVRLFRHAVGGAPADSLRLPFTSPDENGAETWVSLLLRPMVCPEVGGISPKRTMEVRFFAPGSLVSNLDFVESIFGNAGDPYIPDNDAALDVEHWTGHTGCVILAPHLGTLTKKELGLPQTKDATERQKADGMCWDSPDELYNDGSAFKATCRTSEGVVVTLIADNYYGYCKKEVKTQLSYAANLLGNAEEEHAGGALAFPSYSLGDRYQLNARLANGRTFEDVATEYGDRMDVKSEGYGIDREYPQVFYVPENALADVTAQTVSWPAGGAGDRHEIPLLPGNVYVSPSGYKIHLQKHPSAPSWRLIGTVGEGTFCHKPCTVSGGGKSEISKSLIDYMHYGPLYVGDVEEDFAHVQKLIDRKDFSERWTPEKKAEQTYGEHSSRSVLSTRRSLGSVIKLFTPSSDYTDEYNEWLAAIPSRVLAMLFIIKRFHREEWGDDWQSHFGVDEINGEAGHELMMDGRPLVGTYLRVGFRPDGSRRTYKLRQDFAASAKVQTEDDITASTVQPVARVEGLSEEFSGDLAGPGVKFAENCEYRLFQRPDEAIHRGFDEQAELDLASPGTFVSNFEPLTSEEASEMTLRAVDFDKFTKPMQDVLRAAAEDGSHVVSSDRPRIVDGKPTKNPRYLQTRPTLMRPVEQFLAELGTRLYRGIPADKPVHLPVNAQLSGRRNNPPDPAGGIRGLAVYGPIHYQELPELFMDYACSLTGKSPSTTGAGSEGALTKGPFNMLRPAADLNAMFLAMVLTRLGGYSTAAGHIGPETQVDHDVSLLVPEVWCRMSSEERDPERMIAEGMLEPIEDFESGGQLIPASRLGYRITRKFVGRYCGRVFDNPQRVFDEAILRPETQDPASFADGVLHIAEAQKRVALRFLNDGTAEECVPPLRATLHILAEGTWEGVGASDKKFRDLFLRENVLSSDWYLERLEAKRRVDVALWERHAAALDAFAADPIHADLHDRLRIAARREYVDSRLTESRAADYPDSLVGTTGVQPSLAP